MVEFGAGERNAIAGGVVFAEAMRRRRRHGEIHERDERERFGSGVIIGDRIRRPVHHQDDHVGFFQGLNGTHNRVKLNVFFYLGFFTHPGSVNQHKIVPVLVVMDVYRIARGAGNRGNNIPVLTNKRVNDG